MKKLTLTLMACAAMLSSIAVRAGTHTWTGNGNGGNWSIAANWQNNSPPTPGETDITLIFPDGPTDRQTTNNLTGLVVDLITFNGSSYFLAAQSSAHGLTLRGNGPSTLLVQSGLHYIREGFIMTLSNTVAASVAGGSTLFARGAFIGSGGLTKFGDGTLFMDGNSANSYTGTTYVFDGTLWLGASHVFFDTEIADVTVPGPLIIGPAHDAANVAAEVRLTFADQISDSSTVTVNPKGKLTLSIGDERFGALAVNGGIVNTTTNTLEIGGNVTATAPYAGVTNASIQGKVHFGNLSRAFVVASNMTLDVSANLSGGNFGNAYAGLYKQGAGQLNLSGTSTYPGYTDVMEGVLSVRSGRALGSTNGHTSVGTNGQLRLEPAVSMTVSNEQLNLYGNGSSKPCLVWDKTTTWTGPLVVSAPSDVSGNTNAQLNLNGVITTTGVLRKVGVGSLRFGGTETSSTLRELEVLAGTVQLAKTLPYGYRLFCERLQVGRNDATLFNYSLAKVIWENHEQLTNSTAVTINYGGSLELNGYEQSLRHLVFRGGRVETDDGMLRIERSITNLFGGLGSSINGYLNFDDNGAEPTYLFAETNSTLTIHAEIGSDDVVSVVGRQIHKVGAGRVVFMANNTYKQTTHVLDGELELQDEADLGNDLGFYDPSVEENGLLVLNNNSNSGMGIVLKVYPGRDAVHYRGTNIFNSSLFLGFSTNLIRAVPLPGQTNAHLSFSGTLMNELGSGALVFDGPGTVEMSHGLGLYSRHNWHAGPTWFKEGTLLLDRTDGTNVIPTAFTVGQDSGPSAVVRWMSDEQIKDSIQVNVRATGQLDLNGYTETMFALLGSSPLRLADGELIVSAGAYDGYIYGSGGRFTKQGPGEFTLDANNGYTGRTAIKGGVLHVNGIQQLSRVDLETGGTLSGTGRVGMINSSLSYVQPGNSIGILKCAGYSTNAVFATLRVEIAGPTPGIGHDQLDVIGAVRLQSSALEVKFTGGGAISNQYMIVKNDGSDAVTNTFNGLPEGATITSGGAQFQISYVGGDGNDVVLTQKSVPPASQIGGIKKLPDGTIQIGATGTPNALYKVEAATNLNAPVFWLNLGSTNANAIGQIMFLDTNATNFPMRFYRFAQ